MIAGATERLSARDLRDAKADVPLDPRTADGSPEVGAGLERADELAHPTP